MTNGIKDMSKLDKMTMLRDTLIECRHESVHDAEEWLTYSDMMDKVNDLIREERKAQGWSGVYTIQNGQSSHCLFDGTLESCKTYVSILLEGHPEHKGNIIISPLY